MQAGLLLEATELCALVAASRILEAHIAVSKALLRISHSAAIMEKCVDRLPSESTQQQ